MKDFVYNIWYTVLNTSFIGFGHFSSLAYDVGCLHPLDTSVKLHHKDHFQHICDQHGTLIATKWYIAHQEPRMHGDVKTAALVPALLFKHNLLMKEIFKIVLLFYKVTV